MDVYGALPDARANIAQMSRTACRAVIAPAEPGGWPSAWRQAMAARICLLHDQKELAQAYLAEAEMLTAELAYPAYGGRDTRETVVLAFLDRAATAPRQIGAEDIRDLQSAGIGDADIVRLCELVAYIAYECRVSAGLCLLRKAG